MNEDINFANNFFSSVLIHSKDGNNLNESNLPDFRNNVIKVLDFCESIRQKEHYIRTNLSAMSDQCFNEHIKNIESLKCTLNLYMSMLTDPARVESLKIKLAKRTSKRLRLKRLRNTRKSQKNTRRKVNEEKHEEFEKELANVKAEIEEIERIEIVNLEANAKLKDVHKRKSEARKNVSLIDSLGKLRLAREKLALGRGDIVSSADSKIFTSSIEKLKLLWNNALLKYEAEEKTIKYMLETKTENDEVDRVDKTSSIVRNWKCVMFGGDFMPQKDFNGNLERFLLVRKQWDEYMRFQNEGSKIPSGWLTPPPPSESWKKYISHIA